jgi:flagellar hook assembly protein FlgD
VLTLAAAPNPFRAATEIAYNLPERGPVVLTVFDVQGRRVATLVDAQEEAGEHSVTWNGRAEDGTPSASGLYFLHLRAGSETRVQKAILSR